MSEGNRWVEQRRFALRTLRDLGFGKTKMEDLVAEEVDETCRRFEMANGDFIRMDRKFNIPAVNALYKVLTHGVFTSF